MGSEAIAPVVAAPAYLVSGDDPSVVGEALTTLLAELAGGADGWAAVEEHGEPGGDESPELGPVLDALATPPFLYARRTVVLRGAERLGDTQAAELASWLSDPTEGNILVLVAVGRGVPQRLHRAVKALGTVIDCATGQARQRAEWVSARIASSSLRFAPEAARLVTEHLGEDVARLPALLEVLEAAYGLSARIDRSRLEPFLGGTGGVPPWDLTDAIDKGDGAGAVGVLHRMTGAGGRHPLQVMASLHRHFSAMLQLDGAGVTSADDAAGLLKMSPYPARKALEQGRRLGHERIARAVELLAEADADLRGRLDWPPELVMEVLVARLAQLGRRRARPPGRRAAPQSGGSRA